MLKGPGGRWLVAAVVLSFAALASLGCAIGLILAWPLDAWLFRRDEKRLRVVPPRW